MKQSQFLGQDLRELWARALKEQSQKGAADDEDLPHA